MKGFVRETFLYRWYKELRARVAQHNYANPSRDMCVIGVTGTNGKTTTCHLIHYLLMKMGQKSVFVGTTGVLIGDEWMSGVRKMTSYDPGDLQKILAQARDAGCRYAVLEVSSHGLHQHRFTGIEFSTAVLTNITMDHLDYHKDMADYAAQKQKLFRFVQRSEAKNKGAILPSDDQWGRQWAGRMHFPTKIQYGLSRNAGLTAEQLEIGKEGTRGVISYLGTSHPFMTRLVGEFNVQNILAALGACIAQGYRVAELVPALTDFHQIAGRQERYEHNGVDWYIDYAHTPHGLEVMLAHLQKIKQDKRVICVFGAPGLRDQKKRPEMGRVVSEYADVVIVTDDDPSEENRWGIIRDIVAGIQRQEGEDFYVIPRRSYAITMAARIAQPGDIVILTGIGHQDVLVTNFGVVPWSEKGMIEQALGVE